jgi:two-component system, cell cycle response regulator
MRIVVVDPSRTVLKIVTKLLEAGHHEIHPFTDGLAAFEYVKSDPAIDALITSAELGSMSGMDLCKKIRQLPANSRQPIYIVLMSANYEERKLIEALDNGADDFIGKPPATEELYARLRAAERLRSMQRELLRLATTDPLSGLLNRRAFFERAQEACACAGGPKSTVKSAVISAIMFDIDYFKRINDEFGHGVGDDVIRAVASEAMSEKGIVGRLGGEEFAIVLQGRPFADAIEAAELLRRKFAELRLATLDQAVRFTCSFGVSEWRDGESIDHLLKRADVALYSAKKTGRNRVVADDAALAADDRESATSVVRLATR